MDVFSPNVGRLFADFWPFVGRLVNLLDVCSPIGGRLFADWWTFVHRFGGRLFADLVDVCSPIVGRLQSANKRPNVSRYLGMFPK